MRSDSIRFALADQATSREPRWVIEIQFDVASIYFTSHDDIPNVPGNVINGVIQRPSVISQRIIPDEGRSEIGQFTFTIVDKAEALTDALRDQLANQGAGIRRRTVRFWIGYRTFDFTEFQLFVTQVVQGCTYKGGQYSIRCNDITREQRQEIFKPVTTTLVSTCSATDTSIQVNDTSKFVLVAHSSSFSDAPNQTVGYFRLDDEIVRYTSTTPTAFVGCTRGVFNTRAVTHTVDASTPVERRQKVEEFVYLEMPGPKVAYAVLTGVLYGTSNTLPDHWHLGIDPSLVRLSDFLAIGPDLWVPSDDSAVAPLIFLFAGLKAQDGKRFLEKEVYLLLSCFSPVYSDGTLGLRRMSPVISQASPVMTLTERHIVSMSELQHDLEGMHNRFEIDWAYDEIVDDFIRQTEFIDEESIETHGPADLMTYQFRGLHSQRATDAAIAQKLDAIRDRYAEPPQRISLATLGSLNRLENGDVIRVNVGTNVLRDFVGPDGDYNRAFEIQQRTYDAYSGDVTLDLFGSTSRPTALPIGTGATPALPDAFYDSAGTALNAVIPGMVGGSVPTGSFTLTGSTDLTSPSSIFYVLGDLNIPQGCTITLSGNVQLRVRGFLTLNGMLDGAAHGNAGVADPGTGSWDTTFPGNPGFVGGARGWDGVRTLQLGHTAVRVETIPVPVTVAQYSTFPIPELRVSGNALYGLPTDMRGTGGGAGGRVVGNIGGSGGSNTVLSAGGTGANGGAGLCIVCRGMSLGASASITLDGANPATPTISVDGAYPGSGGVGGPGAFLLLLDGDTVSVPVVGGKFSAKSGTITQPGVAMSQRQGLFFNPTTSGPDFNFPVTDSGYADPAVISGLDLSTTNFLPRYIPHDETATPDSHPLPPAPTNMLAGHVAGGNLVTYELPDLDSFDVIEIWASIDNNRTNAVKAGETRASSFMHQLPLGGLRYYWGRSKINPVNGRPPTYSEWEPTGETDGESSNFDSPGEVPDSPSHFTARPRINGIQFSWSLPAYARLLGQIQLYEYTASTPFESASLIWEGYALTYFLTRSDTVTRYYWLVLNRSGLGSVPEPAVVGLSAAALATTAALTANCSPTSLSATATIGANPRFAFTFSTTCIASGGTPPYSYSWDWFSGGSGITIDSLSDPAVKTFSATHNLDGTVLSGVARCTVTDSVSATAFDDVAVQISFPSIA